MFLFLTIIDIDGVIIMRQAGSESVAPVAMDTSVDMDHRDN
jgi:hypothetical protein